MPNELRVKKVTKRMFSFLIGAANNFTGLFFSFFLSWLIADFNTWGEYVYWNLIVNVFAFFVSWGNKEFVMREISQSPARLRAVWTTDVTSRLLLLGVSLPLILLIQGENQLKLLAAGWLLALYLSKSFDSLITYEKKIAETVIFDIVSYLFLILYILFFTVHITAFQLLVWQVITNFLKILFYFFLFKIPFLFSSFQIDITHLKNSFFFFLPSFIGFIQGKTDLFLLMHYMSKTDLGHYQLLLNFAGLFHGGIAAGVSPFIKNIYRLKADAVQKFTSFIKIVACLLIIPYALLVRLIISGVYHIYFSDIVCLLFAMVLIPFLLYFTKNILFFKEGLSIHAAWIYGAGVVVNTAICILMIPAAGLAGALVANIITQWLIFLGLFFIEKKKNL